MANPTGTITRPLVIVILSVCMGSNFQFYSNSSINNIATITQNWMNQSFYVHYGYYIGDDGAMSLLWSFSSAALQFGCLSGVLFTGYLADRFGRRRSLMITSVISAIGSTLDGFSKLANSLELFISGRYLMGLSLGCSLALASMFISEIAPVRIRGACGSTQQIFIGFGNVLSFVLTLSQLLGTVSLWPYSVSVAPFIGSCIQFFVLLFYAYDSPRYLILTSNANMDTCLDALKFYQGSFGADQRLQAIKTEKRALEQGEKFKFMDLFRKKEIRYPLLIALLLIFGAQMSGISALLAYSKLMFIHAGLNDSTAQYASLGVGFCNFLSPILTMILIERLGRKMILLIGLVICDGSLIALTVCLFGSNQYDWPGAKVGAIPSLYVFQIGFALSNSIALISPAELFPQNARASAMTVVFTFSWFLQTVCVLGFLPFSKSVGISYSYLPFIACVSLAIVLLTIFMPETKGKSVEQVAAMFARKTVRDSSENDASSVLKF